MVRITQIPQLSDPNSVQAWSLFCRWRCMEVTFLLKEHCAGAHVRTMRLHDALEKHLPQCTMCSLSTFLTAAAVYAQINCRLSVM